MIAVIAALASTLALLGCGGGPGAKSPNAPKFTGLLRYYPLEKGWHWAFFLRDTSAPSAGLLSVTKVTAFDGHVALLSTGNELSELRVEKDGIVRVSSGAYLLKWPIAQGDKWSTSAGASMVVSKVDLEVTVDAGTFDGCVETVETFRGDEARLVTTTYCPDVGPTLLEVHELAVAPGEVPASATAKLRSFGPLLDFDGKP